MYSTTKLNTPKLAYSVKELTEMLGVSKGHLRNENIRGNIIFLKSGRRILVTAKEVERYLSELAKPESQTDQISK